MENKFGYKKIQLVKSSDFKVISKKGVVKKEVKYSIAAYFKEKLGLIQIRSFLISNVDKGREDNYNIKIYSLNYVFFSKAMIYSK